VPRCVDHCNNYAPSSSFDKRSQQSTDKHRARCPSLVATPAVSTRIEVPPAVCGERRGHWSPEGAEDPASAAERQTAHPGICQHNSAILNVYPKRPLDLCIQVSTVTTTLSGRVHNTTPMWILLDTLIKPKRSGGCSPCCPATLSSKSANGNFA
jgi:hypothetical protein